MPGELHVEPALTVLTLHGELDILNVEALRALLAEAVAAGSASVVVDLGDVPFIDVLSLSSILAAADTLREQHRTLFVRGASNAVRRVCRLLNAEDVLSPVLQVRPPG